MDETLLQSPLAAWHESEGARMVAFAGMLLPVQYPAGLKAEHLSTRSDNGLFDISHMVQMALSADDPEALEQSVSAIFPIDFSKMLLGESRYSFLLNEQGGILDDVIVSRTETGFFVVANGARRNHDPEFLRKKLSKNQTLTVLEDRAFIAFQGPNATEYLRSVLPDLPDMRFMHTAEISWQKNTLRLFRQGYTGEDGWEISLPAVCAVAFTKALAKQHTINPCGLGARDSLRLEAGLPLWGNDIDENITPLMAGLGFAIARSRREVGGYLGAEALGKQFRNPPETKRFGIIGEARQPIRAGTKIFDGDKEVGTVSSGTLSPSLNKPIALVIGGRAYATPNQALEAEVRGKRLAVKTVSLPFVETQYYYG